MTLRRRLVRALGLLLAVVLGAALVYQQFGVNVPFLDAIYMAVVTIATVGYGEIVDTAHNPTLRVFNIFFILFGIGIMLYVFSVSTAFIVEGELRDIFWRRKMFRKIRELKNHFILCGAGETGAHVVEELLKTGHPFVVIDHDEARLEKIRHLGEFPVLKGDAEDEEVLDQAGLERARGLITALPQDKDNLVVTVTVRQKNPDVRIVARCIDTKMADKLIRAGANSTVSPNFIGGLRLASEMIRPHVVSFLDLMLKEQSKTLRVEEIQVPAGSPWVDKTLQDINLHQNYSLLILALRQGDSRFEYNPPRHTKIAEGDILVLMGEVNNMWQAREAAGLTASAHA